VRRHDSSVRMAETGTGVPTPSGIATSQLSAAAWHFRSPETGGLFEKLAERGTPLQGIVARFGTGLQSGADRILIVTPTTAEARDLESALLRPILRGRDVRRYAVAARPSSVIFPYKERKGEFGILSEPELRAYKDIYSYLTANKAALERRVWFSRNAQELSGYWYGMMYLEPATSFSSPHLLTPSLSNRSNFALGTGDLFVTGTAGVTSVIPRTEVREHILYLLALMNSRLISFYVLARSPVFSGGYHKFSAPYLRDAPIRRIDFDSPSDRTLHGHVVTLAEAAMELSRAAVSARIDHERVSFQRQIDATDRKIDELVYELYGLTDKEIRIVTETTR